VEGISGTGGTLRQDFFKEEYKLNNAIGKILFHVCLFVRLSVSLSVHSLMYLFFNNAVVQLACVPTVLYETCNTVHGN
jgi:hypothetical protein